MTVNVTVVEDEVVHVTVIDPTGQTAGSGLPSGGSVGQFVRNTAPGEGDWETVVPADIGAQTHDVDLDAIAALDSTVAGILASDGAGWLTKTYTAVKAALALNNVDNTSDVNKPVSTAQAAAIAAEASARASADALLVALTLLGVANGVATLGADGKLSPSQVPAIAINDFLGAVGSQAAMLALTGQRGDWCIRTDTSGGNTAWILIHDDPTQLGNWQELPTPVGGVIDVNGRNGHVTGLAENSDLLAEVARALAAEALLQPLDADLTAIAALDSSTPGAIASDGAGWIKKTYAQLKTALGLTKSDVGLGNVDNTADASKHFDGSQVTTGTVPMARIFTSGVPNGLKFLRDDGALAFTHLGLAPTPVKAVDWSPNIGELVPMDTTAAPRTITLPTAPGDNTLIAVELVAGSNAVTINAGGSDTFQKAGGAASMTLTMPEEVVILEYQATYNIWYVVAHGYSRAQLDARFQALNSNLTTIGGLSAANDDVLQRKAGAWTNRTLAQLTTDLNLNQVALVNLLLAGMTIPTNSLDKWKAGYSRSGTMLAADSGITNAVTSIPYYDLAIAPVAGQHRRLTIESEEVFTTAGENTLTAISGVTSVASTGTFTKTAHGLVDGQIVSPDSGLLNSFLVVGGRYYIVNTAANTFQLATSPGGRVLTGTTNDTALVLNTIVLTITRGINWSGSPGGTNLSTAAAHSAKAPIYAPRHKTIIQIGDSTVEGSDNEHPYQQNDAWGNRAARMLSERMGGAVAKCWPWWRNTGTPSNANEDYSISNPSSGLFVEDYNASHDVGWPGALFIQAEATPNPTVLTWTRPTYERVAAIDFHFVDYGSGGCGWSYSIDGGSTWIDCPVSTVFSSGKGILRRMRIAVNDPTDFRVRSCSSAGTAHTLIIPKVPIVTWNVWPTMATTDGVFYANLGWPGKLLSGILNARFVTDAVTNGTTTITSATAAFVANDVKSYVFVNGVQYTIASVTNGTTAVLSGSPASATGVRLTILQGSGTGDWMGQFFGHHGSWFPDLAIIGTLVNDAPTFPTGQLFYSDMFQFLITQLQPYCDILIVAPYEYSSGSATPTVQANFRAALHTLAAANNVAILDLYDAFAAYGFTGFTALNSAGYMQDNVHLSYKGNNWIASHLTRALGVV